MRGKEMGDIGMLKGALLAWTLRREGWVVGHRGISIVTGSTEEKRGRNSKYIASKCIAGQ